MSDVPCVADVRLRVAAALRVHPWNLQLLKGAELVSDAADLGTLGSCLTAVVDCGREPAWLPLNKYTHNGKEVLRMTGSSSGRMNKAGCMMWTSRDHQVHYVDGSTSPHNFKGLDRLIEDFGFVVYEGMSFAGCRQAVFFEAVPPEDPCTQEDSPVGGGGGSFSGWRRKRDHKEGSSRRGAVRDQN